MAPSPEVKQKFDNRLHPKPDAVGYLGIPNGVGGYLYDMPFRPGSIYARIQLGVEFEIGEVRAGSVARDPDLKLNFFKVNGILTAQNPNGDGATALYGSNAGNAYLVPHSLDHHNPAVALVDFGGQALVNGGAAHFNVNGLDEDVQVQGLTDHALLFTDASADKVGIGTALPSEKLSVAGKVVAQTVYPSSDNAYDLGKDSILYRAAYAYANYLKTRSAPATPAAGLLVLYAGTDKHPHAKNEDGTDFDLTTGGSPLTTKGDLYTFDTAAARLPVGTTGQILNVDPTQATGLKWIDNPSATHRWEPLVYDGDIVFYDGDIVMVYVEI